MRQHATRLVVLGLDGLPLDLAKRLAATGKLPNLARLAQSPNARAIEAELPELSPVNWTSLVTAQNPGVHGIHGFTTIDPASYVLSTTDATAVKCPNVLDAMTRAGRVAVAINLPAAWPVKPTAGATIAGFVAPDLDRAVFPPALLKTLKQVGYKIEADTTRGAADPDYLLAQCRATLRARRTALELLWSAHPWELFLFVLTETDRLFHFFFPAFDNPSHPLHAPMLDLLADWDTVIGRLLERYDALPEPKRLVALADHGFDALEVEVDLNAWLRRNGLLATSGQARDEWDSGIIGPKTAAFALDPGRIYIHAKERFARGVFHEFVARDLRETIRDNLMALTYEGRPVMEAVHRAEDIYAGPETRQAPDLVCVARPGFGLTGKFDRTDIFGRHGRFGRHAAHGAFFYDSLGQAPARLSDAGGLLFETLNLTPGNTTAWILTAT